MSFFSSSPYKPQVRQEGFSPLSPDTTNNDNSHSPIHSPHQGPGGSGNFNDLFSLPAGTYLGDGHTTARKYPSASMNFSEELASLTSSTTSSSNNNNNNNNANGYDDHHRYGATTHNIFDVSAVPIPHPSSVSSTTTGGNGNGGGLGSQPSSFHSEYHHQPQPAVPQVFNSTLPALNSSMRYEPLPPPSHQQGGGGSPGSAHPLSSSYHTFSVGGGNRHTPSPIMTSPPHSHSISHHSQSHHDDARSRSRSRPPTSSSNNDVNGKNATSPTLSNAQSVSSIGPARTTRGRRNNSVSSTSPPPYGGMHGHGRPHAIVIPGSARGQPGGNGGQGGQGWFVSSSSASEYSLPTPNDTHPLAGSSSNGSSSNNNTNAYSSFSLSSPTDVNGNTNGGMHLPPVSSLHSPLVGSYHGHGHGHSLSMGSHRDYGMNSIHGHHGHTMSVPGAKSPGGGHNGGGHGPVLDYVLPPYNANGNTGGGNNGGNGGGMTPPGVGVMGIGSPVLSAMGMGGIGMGGMPGSLGGMGMGGVNISNSGRGNNSNGLMGAGSPISGVLSSSLPSSGGTAIGVGLGVGASASSLGGGTLSLNGHGHGHGHGNGITSSASGGMPNGSSSSAAASGSSSAGPLDKQALLANEKRRRRRESHNAVERRRRDNINEKISELATLIPECLLDGSGAAGGSGGGGSPSALASSPGLLDTTDPLLPSPAQLEKKEQKEGSVKEESGGNGSEEGTVVKANKGMILRKSVEYIRYLQQLVTAQGARNRELEQELKAYRGGSVPSESGSGSGSGDSKSSNLNNNNTSNKDGSATDDVQGFDTLSASHFGFNQEDQEMMLHDAATDFGVGGMGHLHHGRHGHGHGHLGVGMLPSMPEDEDEDDDAGDEDVMLRAGDGDGEGMDIDEDGGAGSGKNGRSGAKQRGRPRVSRRGTGDNESGNAFGIALKEEQEDTGLTAFGGLAMVSGMQA